MGLSYKQLLRAISSAGIVDVDVRGLRTRLQGVGADFVGAGASAFDAMVQGLKADGTWAAITDIHLLCGISSLTGALVPLKTSAPGLTTLANVGFTSNDYVATGLDAGINDYDNISLIASGVPVNKTLHAGATPYVANMAIGAFVANRTGNNAIRADIGFPYIQQNTPTTLEAAWYGFGGGDIIGVTGHMAGDIVVNRASSSSLNMILRGVSVATNLGASASSPSAGNLNLLENPFGANLGSRACAAYFKAHNISDAQAISIRNRMQTALSAIGRTNGMLTVAGDGDSLTYGTGVGVTSWMTYLKASGGAAWAGRYIKSAANGRAATTAITQFDINIRWCRPDPSFSTRGLYFCWLTTNDLQSGATSAAALTSLRSLWSSARSAGFRVIAFTDMPRADAAWTGAMETQRLALNSAIIADTANYDALIRVDTLFPDPNNATLFQGDKLHLTDTGEQLIATTIVAQINPATV